MTPGSISPVTVMDVPISKTVHSFNSWFVSNGGFFHPHARFQPDPSGHKVIAEKEIPADTTIITCPFGMAITKEVATRAILTVLKTEEIPSDWTERQLICTYICLHWVFEASPEFPKSLAHLPYLKILPKPEQLLTPLHFSDKELDLFRGSHLHAATEDRKNVMRSEWQMCLEYLTATPNADVYQRGYTWEQYLTAATYLSSRAFPSTLMSENPSVSASKGSYPVLFPGVDSLNHRRGHPVSWIISPMDPGPDLERRLSLSLSIHSLNQRGEELLNNYGAKPNSELILGYGFSLEANPDDTIVLSISGGPATSDPSPEGKERWEVGRNARGVEGVWNYVLNAISSGSQPEEAEESENIEVENRLEAAGMLSGMCQSYLDRLPKIPPASDQSPPELRPEVLMMLAHYIEGQRDILQSMLTFAQGKENQAVEEAQKLGIELESE